VKRETPLGAVIPQSPEAAAAAVAAVSSAQPRPGDATARPLAVDKAALAVAAVSTSRPRAEAAADVSTSLPLQATKAASAVAAVSTARLRASATADVSTARPLVATNAGLLATASTNIPTKNMVAAQTSPASRSLPLSVISAAAAVKIVDVTRVHPRSGVAVPSKRKNEVVRDCFTPEAGAGQFAGLTVWRCNHCRQAAAKVKNINVTRLSDHWLICQMVPGDVRERVFQSTQAGKKLAKMNDLIPVSGRSLGQQTLQEVRAGLGTSSTPSFASLSNSVNLRPATSGPSALPTGSARPGSVDLWPQGSYSKRFQISVR